ncbi:MAG: uracil-DNA glycosylase [Actinomycetes bacterium]
MIPPGRGHPTDRATPSTPVARDAADVARLASSAGSVADIDARSSVCRACPRLVEWRERVAVEKRAAYADWEYWGRPITGWGDDDPRLLVSGLAPAAHGGNRTGRIFTGDRSGDWLFAALHRAGLANQPTSVSADDGLRLTGVRIVVPVRCAPPANKPTPTERDTCGQWLAAELRLLLLTVRCVVVLGSFGWAALGRALRGAGVDVGRLPAFGHGVEAVLPGGLVLLGCYHVSQQNTFTGRLTESMLDDVFARAKELSGLR